VCFFIAKYSVASSIFCCHPWPASVWAVAAIYFEPEAFPKLFFGVFGVAAAFYRFQVASDDWDVFGSASAAVDEADSTAAFRI